MLPCVRFPLLRAGYWARHTQALNCYVRSFERPPRSAKPAPAASKPPLPPTAAWALPAAATGPSGRASGGGGEQEGGGSGGGGDGRGVYKWPSGADEFGLFESVVRGFGMLGSAALLLPCLDQARG
jgi:hypothetical protein